MNSHRNTKVRISIITPSFNQDQFIEETILSVKNQDYKNIEHIIIDGNSTDKTLDILKKYDRNLVWLSEQDNGQSEAINKGIEMAKGELIGWLNSDDVYLFNNIISEVVNFFNRNSDVDVVFGDLAIINEQSKILRFYHFQDFNYDKLLSYRYNLGQPSVFFRSKILKENKIREDLHYVMDYELWLRLGRKCKFKHIPKTISGFRIHSKSKTGGDNEKDFITERKKVLSEYGSKEEERIIIKIIDKIFRGGIMRGKGLLNLIKYQYFSKNKLTFNGRYLKLPLNIYYQILVKLN